MKYYTLGQKASLNKYRRIKIISHILPYHTEIKQEGKRGKKPKNVSKYIETEHTLFNKETCSICNDLQPCVSVYMGAVPTETKDIRSPRNSK